MAAAPDSTSQIAGRRLARPGPWSAIGVSDGLLWGECQGSGKTPYRVTVDTGGRRYQCSCPSRKFPCKHALGLLFLWAERRIDESGEIASFAKDFADRVRRAECGSRRGARGANQGADRSPAGGRRGARGRAGTTGRGRAGRVGSLARRPGVRRVGPSGAGSLRLVGADRRPDGRCAGSRGGVLAAPAARRHRLRVRLAGPVAGRTRPAAPADPRVRPARRTAGRPAGDRPRPRRVHRFPGRCARRAAGAGSLGGGLLPRPGHRVGVDPPSVVARQQIRPVGAGAVLRCGRSRAGFLAGSGHRPGRRSALLSGAGGPARGGRHRLRGRGPGGGLATHQQHRRRKRPTAGRPRWPPIPGSTRSRWSCAAGSTTTSAAGP